MEILKAVSGNFILLEKGEIKNIGYKTNIIELDKYGNPINLTKICFNYSGKREDCFYFNSSGKFICHHISEDRPEYLIITYEISLNSEITSNEFIELITEVYVKVELGFFY